MRSSTESERTISRNTLMRFSSKNMCSVRTSPMPLAPNLRARAASRGLSALARTWKPGHELLHQREEVEHARLLGIRLDELGLAEVHRGRAVEGHVEGDVVALP